MFFINGHHYTTQNIKKAAPNKLPISLNNIKYLYSILFTLLDDNVNKNKKNYYINKA